MDDAGAGLILRLSSAAGRNAASYAPQKFSHLLHAVMGKACARIPVRQKYLHFIDDEDSRKMNRSAFPARASASDAMKLPASPQSNETRCRAVSPDSTANPQES